MFSSIILYNSPAVVGPPAAQIVKVVYDLAPFPDPVHRIYLLLCLYTGLQWRHWWCQHYWRVVVAMLLEAGSGGTYMNHTCGCERRHTKGSYFEKWSVNRTIANIVTYTSNLFYDIFSQKTKTDQISTFHGVHSTGGDHTIVKLSTAVFYAEHYTRQRLLFRSDGPFDIPTEVRQIFFQPFCPHTTAVTFKLYRLGIVPIAINCVRVNFNFPPQCVLAFLVFMHRT